MDSKRKILVDYTSQQRLNELKKRKRRLEEALRAIGGYNPDIECELDEIEEEIESLSESRLVKGASNES